MGNETAAVKRPTAGRRGGTTGRQTVGEYTGQRAGDAAQAVRRAGLRPGLERSFGCAPDLLGLVVSQEPAAGSALARNGMVTLHVAAPGTGSAAADTTPASEPAPPQAPERTRESEPAPAPLEGGSGASDRELQGATGTARRRRKPGLSGRAPQAFGVAPAPIPPAAPEPQAVEDGEPEWGELVEPEPTYEVDGAELSEETISEEDGFDGLTADEFVVHVDDVFAGRTGRWRPVRRAPRTRDLVRGVRERFRAHPWLAGSAAFAIGAWLLLGTLGALAGQHSPAPERTAPGRLSARDPIAHPDRASRAAVVGAALRRRGEHRTSTRRPARRSRPIARPARAARPHVPTPALRPAPERPAAAAPSVPSRASEPPPPAPAEQRSGGLFSP